MELSFLVLLGFVGFFVVNFSEFFFQEITKFAEPKEMLDSLSSCSEILKLGALSAQKFAPLTKFWYQNRNFDYFISDFFE